MVLVIAGPGQAAFLLSLAAHAREVGARRRTSFQTVSATGGPRHPRRFPISQMIHMSSRASPGGSSALRSRCTRRSLLVTVPSASHQADEAGKTTCASSAVRVRKMSCTCGRDPTALGPGLVRLDWAGFSPMT